MRFGVAVRDITPAAPMVMHGYAARQDLSDGVNDPLELTAIILEAGERRALLVAADLCTFPNDETTPALMDRLAAAVECPREAVMLNASHTHGGPLIPGRSWYSRANRGAGAARTYAAWLADQAVEAAHEARARLAEGSLWYGEGRSATPMNRRKERTDGRIDNAPNPGGPVDDRMQLLVLRDADGDLAAVGMRLSCHPVATGAQHRFTADFPGAWRAEFTRAFGPTVTPFFLQGAGADARPRQVADGDRWRKLDHSELPALGRELLHETLAVLTRGDLQELHDLCLEGTLAHVQAPCETRYPTAESLATLTHSPNATEAAYAAECLRRLTTGDPIPASVPLQVQTLRLNDTHVLLGLDVEPLVGLARRVEAATAPAQAILLGYTNGCVGYAPDTAELLRGGYEATSYLYQPWTGPLLPGLEDLLASAVRPKRKVEG